MDLVHGLAACNWIFADPPCLLFGAGLGGLALVDQPLHEPVDRLAEERSGKPREQEDHRDVEWRTGDGVGDLCGRVVVRGPMHLLAHEARVVATCIDQAAENHHVNRP